MARLCLGLLSVSVAATGFLTPDDGIGRGQQVPFAQDAGLDTAGWLRVLTADGVERLRGERELLDLLVRVARSEARRRGPGYSIAGVELEDLAQQAAADAFVAVTGKLHQFRGESQFTTWAFKFVVLEVATKLARHFWRHAELRLDEESWDRLPDRFGLAPDQESEWRDVVAGLRRAVDTVLTAHQRRVFVALVLNGVPLDALAAELGTNRNALYKTLFDARRKLRAALVAGGQLDATGGRPDAAGGRPDAAGGRPDTAGGRPDTTSGSPA